MHVESQGNENLFQESIAQLWLAHREMAFDGVIVFD